MENVIVLLSGSVASGKSTLASLLEREFDCRVIKTWQLLKAVDPAVNLDRGSLQVLGESLDKKTGGEWVVEELDKVIRSSPLKSIVIVDAVRIQGQIDAIRRGYGRNVKHIHLEAPNDTLEARYEGRDRKSIKEFESHSEVLKDNTEQAVPKLARTADIVIDTHRNTPDDVLVRSACHLGLYGRGYDRHVDVLIGGQYGSEGKGQIAAYLAPEYDVLIRVGGPNAGHSVYENPTPDVFHSLPSGTNRATNSKIVLGAGAVVNIETLWHEINSCELSPDRLTIDPQVLLITKRDITSENANVKSMGSTGQGVGAATARRILHRGVRSVPMARDVEKLRPYIRPANEVIEHACRNGKRLFLEGTQGTGLSLYHGDYPHVTSRDTTVAGCLAEAGISPNRVRKVIMVCRTYPIRVQNPEAEGTHSGPMSQEISLEEIALRSGILLTDLKKTETTTTTKRQRRISEFDWRLLKRAAELNAPTDIALTFVDYLGVKNQDARRFEQLTDVTLRFIEEVERVGGAPVSLIATRFHHRSIIDRRGW
ncbi:adenylosuccinate synthetase [Rubinisphaera sp.]|uniref:adenylosuccinate synthetase n=1 Tax=Rubinisphaera sp. TaxID=2024857 RepID=UPI000C10F48A|nr:adenylosuccinate synthetase [Rubinisphaera sp.]MBV08839.1 adenylosuccinate synthase [Rubinisphaera sp.]HCS54753.1 adenylosuccinate synthase [Planctomycetaceae bacterium]|tara:strand:- start:5789 stop:7402 length:1614 start_codon:yes stop_codon:yes gene_type:complete